MKYKSQTNFKQNRIFTLFITIFIMSSFFSCAVMEPPPPVEKVVLPEEKPEPPEKVVDIQQETYSNYIMASLYIARRDYKTAKQYLMVTLKNDPDSIYLNKRMAVLMQKLNNTEEAFNYALRSVDLDPNDIGAHILLAELYAIARDKKAEIEEYETVLTLDPKNQRVRMVLATILIRNSQFDEAMLHLNELVRQNPDLTVAYYYRGRIQQELGNLKQAEEEYLKTLELNESMEPALFNLGGMYQLQKRFEEAEQIYKRLLSFYPSNLAAKERLINIYERLGQREKTQDLLDEIKNQTKPGDPGRQTLGLFYLQHGKLAESIAELDLIVSAWPEDYKSRYYLALAYEEYGQPESALEHYRTIEEGNDYYINAQIRMAHILDTKEEYEEAVTILRKVIDLEKTRSDLYIILASFLERRKEYDEAIATIKEGLKYNTSNIDLIFRFGVILDKSGDKDGSIVKMKEILEIDPDHADSLNYIGYTYAEEGIRLDEALDLIQRALKIKPNSGYIIDSLGWVYYQQGLYEKAMVSLEKAFTLISDDPTIAEHLGDVYHKLNDYRKSLEMYQKALTLDHEDENMILEKIENIKSLLE